MYKFNYDGKEYNFNPELEVPYMDPVTNELSFGDKLRNILGMSDEEVLSCHTEGLLNQLRFERNKKLIECDWSGVEDLPQKVKDTWRPYRQALRDITDTYNSLEEVIWPDKPE